MSSLQLAVASKNKITILNPLTPDDHRLSITQPFTPSTLAWTTSNTHLFFASSSSIRRIAADGSYDKSILSVKGSSGDDRQKVTSMAVKDGGSSIVFSKGSKVFVWDVQAKRIVSTMEGQASAVNSVLLNKDESLLATISSNAVHVWTLENETRQMLKGCPLAISASTFDPHRSSHLLLATKSELLIYDTQNPSTPSRRIPISSPILSSSQSSPPIQITCSPHYKSLLAVGYHDGQVKIVDLDATDEPVIKTIDFEVPLTSVCFVNNGRGLAVGTEIGRLITCDLAAMDKPFQESIIDPLGGRITAISMMRKPPRQPKGALSENNAVPTSATTKSTSKSGSSETSAKGQQKRTDKQQSQPHNPKVIEEKENTGRASPLVAPSVTGEPSTRALRSKPSSSALSERPASPPVASSSSTKPTSKKRLTSNPTGPSTSPTTHEDLKRHVSESDAYTSKSTGRSRAKSVASSRPGSEAGQATGTPASGSAPPSSTTTPMGDPPPVPIIRKASGKSKLSSHLEVDEESSVAGPSRPPSQQGSSPRDKDRRRGDLSGTSGSGSSSKSSSSNAPPEPSPERKRPHRVGSSLLASQTNLSPVAEEPPTAIPPHVQALNTPSHAISTALQLSPYRPTKPSALGLGSSPTSQHHPVKHTPSPNQRGHSSTLGNAAVSEMLRMMIKDVLCETQDDVRREIQAVHLEVVKSKRICKNEMRKMMQEYAGDLRELREENERLRRENDKLRRGY